MISQPQPTALFAITNTPSRARPSLLEERGVAKGDRQHRWAVVKGRSASSRVGYCIHGGGMRRELAPTNAQAMMQSNVCECDRVISRDRRDFAGLGLGAVKMKAEANSVRNRESGSVLWWRLGFWVGLGGRGRRRLSLLVHDLLLHDTSTPTYYAHTGSDNNQTTPQLVLRQLRLYHCYSSTRPDHD